MSDNTKIQAGGISGPDNMVSHYVINDGENPVIVFGSPERPGASPMFVSDLLRHLHQPYHIGQPENGWRTLDSFTDEEKRKLRPIAETLAMLDSNAFFGAVSQDGHEHYEGYLAEAAALLTANGGSWGGRASFDDEFVPRAARR